MIKFKSLNTSKQFIGILKKKKLNNKYFTIYFDKNLQNINEYLNITFVMKKKIGWHMPGCSFIKKKRLESYLCVV